MIAPVVVHPDDVDDADGDVLVPHMMVLDSLADVIASTFCDVVMGDFGVYGGLYSQMMLVARMMMVVEEEVLQYCLLVEVGGCSFLSNGGALVFVVMRSMIRCVLLLCDLTCDYHQGVCGVVLTWVKHLIASLV